MSTTKDKEDEDSSTKQILEYYTKYSQSRDLPKYFSGSVQYLPKIVDDDDEESIKTETRKNTKDTVSEIDKKYENYEPNLELSPTGSTASNRKLEWDSLGDIGYIQRSASLPILTHKKQKGNNVEIVLIPYSSSSEEASSDRNTIQSSSSSPLEEKCIPTSSSSNSKEHQRSLSTDLESPHVKKIVEFKQSLDSIKKKIGLPGAHSTPNDSQSSKNKRVTNIEKSVEQFIQEDINNEKSYKGVNKEIDEPSIPSKKVINLCLTKPVLLDCLSHTNTKKLTIGIQTDDLVETEVPKQPHQLVTYYKHSDTLKSSSDSAKSTSSNVVASQCDSFEYIKNNSNDRESIQIENNVPVENPKSTNENIIPEEDQLDSVKYETSSSFKTNDIERGVYVLQRLIKSKRYDSTTKKRYIKKVLQKITESKYLDDSTTSSDLFYPKVPQDHLKNSSFKNEKNSIQEEKKSPKKIKSYSTDSDVPYRKESKAGPSKSEPKTSKVETVQSSSGRDKKKVASSSDNGLLKEQAPTEIKKTPFTVTKCQEISSDPSSCSPQSYQNWKELKTVSEKVFESNGQTVGGGDHISHFVNKERDYQLNWINKEINHLGKLKHILEKTKKTCNPPACMKKTSVYMVTTGNKEIKRNYVIETKLGMPSSVQRNFILNGENYTVKNPNDPCGSSKDTLHPVVADIQVQSTDKTTNIKVTTFCKICRRAPCVCVTDFLQGISNPFEISHKAVKEHLDNKSKSCTCSSNSTTSSNTTSGRESSKTICIVCHRYPCTCCSCKQTHSVKTCSVCQLYCCMCVISPKGSAPSEPYVGTFIPSTRVDQCSHKPKKIFCCNCKVYPCRCGLSSTSSTTKNENTGTSSKTPSNSLTKVFTDCKCGPSSKCQCPFVDKLLRHFNKEKLKVGFSTEESTLRKKSSSNVCNSESYNRDKRLQTEYNRSKNKYIQSKLETASQGDTDISSGSLKTDQYMNTIQKEATTYSHASTNNKESTSTSVPKIFTNLPQEDQCLSTKEEKAVNPTNQYATEEKSTGKTVKENLTQNYVTYKTAEKATSSRVTTNEKGVECNCETTVCDDKRLQTEYSLSKNKYIQSKLESASQGDTDVSSGSLKTDQYVNTIQKEATTYSHASTNNKESTSTSVPKFFTNVPQEDQCLSTKEEKAVHPTNQYATEEKSTGKTVKDNLTQNYVTYKTAEKATSSRVITSEKSVECNCETTVCDKCIGTNDKKPSADRSTSPRTCLVDKGTVCDPRGLQVDKGTSPKRSQTSSDRRELLVDEGTSCTPVLIDKGSEYSPRTTVVDKYTSCASSRIDKGTEPEPKSSVDKCVSSRLNVDKESEWVPRKVSRDQGTFTNSQTDKGTGNYRKSSLDKGTSPITFAYHQDDGNYRKGSLDKGTSPVMFVSNQYGGGTPDEITSDVCKVSETDDSSTPNSSSNCTCCCCETSVPLERISMLRSDDHEFPVCKECLEKRPVLTTVCFADDDSSSNNPKYTKDYLRKCENFCTCKRNLKNKDFVYCYHCKNRLRKTQQSRNGIAYTLTLEDEPPENFKTRTKKKLKKLEEIKIKVPNPYSRKQHKNRENNHKRDEDRMKKIESGENSEDETLIHCTNYETSSNSDTMNNENNRNCTLQEYLRRNRPGFVNSAEFRRLAMINNKIERELNKDDLKLKFMEQNVKNNKLKCERLFSEKEMREITRRNYKKLPEVQQKLIDQRLQKLRNADKFMADMMKRKIQNCVLKGKSSFPIDTNIINVYK